MKKFYLQILLLFVSCTTTLNKDANLSPEDRLTKWDSGVQYHVDTLPLDPDSEQTILHPSEVELGETTREVMRQVEALRPSRVVFDSLSEMRLLAQNPLRYRRQILDQSSSFPVENARC